MLIDKSCHSRYEAAEVRDGDVSRYFGCGVRRAVSNVLSVIAPAITGKDPREQADIDRLMTAELDESENKVRMGERLRGLGGDSSEGVIVYG